MFICTKILRTSARVDAQCELLLAAAKVGIAFSALCALSSLWSSTRVILVWQVDSALLRQAYGSILATHVHLFEICLLGMVLSFMFGKQSF